MKYNLVVAGGGLSGVAAAVSAAREGLKVLLVEKSGCLGGAIANNLVYPFMPYWTKADNDKKYLSQGILKEIKARHDEYVDDCKDHEFNSEYLKIVLDDITAEAGVDVLFHAVVYDVKTESRRVSSVEITAKAQKITVEADFFIDATGDGDVAAYAGVPYIKGRESDGRMQPATLMFKVGGVAPDGVIPGSFETLVPTEKGELQALAKEILPHPAGHVLLYRNTTPGTVVCNMTNAIEVDGTDAESVTRGLMTCRSQIPHIIKFLREFVPGYENCWLMGSASLLGIRETRHFEGLQTLTKEDILEARLYENWVVRRGHFNFDVHNLTGASLDKTGVQKNFTQKGEYSIPYGCLLPRNVEGLLLSGRNISGSHMAHSNFRIMSVCIAIGEAAGLAAALSLKENVALRDLDVKKIQDKAGI